ncbi:MAG: hypothetical protein ACRDJM_06585 [Actinomycetota bacterium]
MRRFLPVVVLLLLAFPLPALPVPAGGCLAATEPLLSGPCPGIRPGARMTWPAGCTMNFVFRGSTANDVYIGTAAHCVGYVGSRW